MSSLFVALFVALAAGTAMAAWPTQEYGATNASLPQWVINWHTNFFNNTGLDYSYLPIFKPGHGTETPGELGTCPTNEELEAFLDQEMAASGGTMKWKSMYEYYAAASLTDGVLTYETNPTTGERKLIRFPFVVFSKEGVFEPEEVLALKRPVVWLQGQIHGNESTGSDSMQVMIRRLAEGDLKYILDKVVVLIVPRANPEGAWRWTRANNASLYTQGMSQSDPNRDGIWFESIIQRAVHKIMNPYRPHVVIDEHEQGAFSGRTERVYTNPAGSTYFTKTGANSDTYSMNTISMLYAPHPSNSPTITSLGYEFEKDWNGLMDQRGIRHAVYHADSGTSYIEGSVRSGDQMVPGSRQLITWRLEADGDPRMVDPSYGLKGAVSLLSESSSPKVRVLNNNRTYGHNTVAEALLLTTYNNADYVYATVERGRKEQAELGDFMNPSNLLTLSYLFAPDYDDPTTNKESFTEYYLVQTTSGIVEQAQEVKVGRMGMIPGVDSGYVPSSVIVRPHAYIIDIDASEVDAFIDRLSTSGVRFHRLTEDATIDVTAFKITLKDRQGVNSSTTLWSSKTQEPWPHMIETASYQKSALFKKGTLIMYMNQPIAPYGALSLDPDSCWNFANIWFLRTGYNGLNPKGFLPVGEVGADFPVYRLMSKPELPVEEIPYFDSHLAAFNEEKPALLSVDDEDDFLEALGETLVGVTSYDALMPVYVEFPEGVALSDGTYTLDEVAMKKLFRVMGGNILEMADARWFFMNQDGDVAEVPVNDGATSLTVNFSDFGFTSSTSRRPEIPVTGNVVYVKMVAANVDETPAPTPSGGGSSGCNAGIAGILLIAVLPLVIRRKAK